jgi:hypothetical protein
MKNINILPTTESSRLKDENLYSSPSYVLSSEPLHWRYAVHMYITSEDEDIYENDYIITQEGKLVQVSYLLSSDIYKSSKVIMTTSQKLIEDGVQEIDETFLQWFIDNFKCEYVQVKKQYITPLGVVVETCYDNERLNYKIIIPEEEPKYVFGITKGEYTIGNTKINTVKSEYSIAMGYNPETTSKPEGHRSIVIGNGLISTEPYQLLVDRNGIKIDKIMSVEEYELLSQVLKSINDIKF